MKSVVPGYMIVITLMISALAVAAVTTLARKQRVYLPLISTSIEKNKAEQLALSGIQIALSQLAGNKEKKTDTNKKTESEDQRMLSFLLPILGRWQTFELNEKRDGIRGIIKICITSEDGKLNLNEIYDFKQKKFLGEKEANEEKNYRKIIEHLLTSIGATIDAPSLFRGLEEFLKKRDAPVSDITQLLTIKEFAPFKSAVFYQPSSNKKNIALTDIFTTWGTHGALMNAWLLSPSIQRTIGSTQSDFMSMPDDGTIKKIIESYDPNLKLIPAWEKIFAPLYGIPLASLPTYVKGLLDIKFGPTVFSVLSYGTVGKMTQKLLAIITLKKDPSSEIDAVYSVVIKKLYWL